jgi:DNA primase
MARIPNQEVERLRSSVDLAKLIESDGFTLKKIGKDLACACPFHAGDAEPSLIVTPDKNLFHCFACGAAGSPIDWVMRRRGVSFRRAVELLRGEAHGGSAEALSVVPRAAGSRVVAPLVPGADDAVLLGEVVDFYHQTLRGDASALAYLAQRGLRHPELIEHFKLGFANRTLAYRLPEKQVKSGAAVRGQLQRLGVLRVTGHEHFQGSLVVPVFDAEGRVAELYGRKITDKQREGVPLHLYLPGPHRGVFNRAGWRGAEEVILCEALLDALTFWCAGFRNVTSAFGVGGFTDDILDALVAHGTRRVLIAYDGDEAGDRAAGALVPKLAERGIASSRVVYPAGMDANAFALTCADAREGLGRLLEQAVVLGKARLSPVTVPEVIAASVVQSAAEVVAVPAAAEVIATPAVPEILSLVADRSGDDCVADTATATACLAGSALQDLASIVLESTAQQVVIALGDRRYRVRGLAKNLSIDTLRINLLASCAAGLHVDSFDLYAAKARAQYIKQAASAMQLGEAVIERDLARVLVELETLQTQAIRAAVTPQPPQAATMTPERQDAALAMLRDPQLAERIVRDVGAIGVVGEDSNALVGYLACVSRKLERPLAVLIQSTSAAGKSTLMDALLSLMPEAERVHYSAMTGQSLFYLGEGDLKHKILAIAEEEGVRQAAYALKLLQSQGELTIASTGKDPATGKLVTEDYRVEGPVMLFLTSTAIDLDEELLNRCLVLTINESRAQTEAIHRRQRQARTLAGLCASREAEAIRGLHRDAQQLLRPLAVVNPFAEALTFRSESTRMRRDHAKYLTLIDAIALLHQHQRPLKTTRVAGELVDYVEVIAADIALANRLAHEVLGRSLDELPPQTRRVLGIVVGFVRERAHTQDMRVQEVRFTRREVRALCGITDTALRLHLERLVELDYLIVHRGGFGSRFVYELAFDGEPEQGAVHLIGLIDVASLEAQSSHPETTTSHPGKADLAPTSHPAHTHLAPTSHGVGMPRDASTDAAFSSLVAASEPTALQRTHATPRATKTYSHNGAARP